MAARAPTTVSPRQVADALGVSESSVKRWSDQGLMETAKTAGGHRKLVLADVLRFVREQGYDLDRPEALGLPGRKQVDADDARAHVVAALVSGDSDVARRMVVGLYTRGVPLTEVFDRVLGPAMREVGTRWEHGDVRVFEEHRATWIAMRALADLRALLPLRRGKRRAVVATLNGDPYTVAITMAELALIEAGWAVTNLGPDTPAFTLVEALGKLKPRLLGLGVNYTWPGFAAGYEEVAAAARQHRTAIVIGGPALTDPVRAEIHFAARCESMRELADFAASL